jgi:cyclopropane-fatty-acyl-phospholipid synthase
MAVSLTPWRTDGGGRSHLTLAQVLELLAEPPLPFHFTAYDGSSAGPIDAAITLNLRSARGAAYLASAPGDLGMARAYVSGDLEIIGVHPGDPYPVLAMLNDELSWRRPDPLLTARVARALGVSRLVPPTPPPQEVLPDWRRTLEGLRHSRRRDAEAIHHHYDVSNRFYEYVLGPSMAYTCACYPGPDATLEQAQEYKHDLVARKLGLRSGMRPGTTASRPWVSRCRGSRPPGRRRRSSATG